MKINIKVMVLFGFVSVFFIMQPLSVFAELIEPSRTLESQQKPTGRLSVFSEPPGLDVFLDGINIGKTPVISREMASGTYVLRVKETEEEIVIQPEKSLEMSFFKNSLITIPEKKVEIPEKTKPEEQPTIQEKKPEDSKKEKKQLDPFYFPTNPSGPIR